MGVERFEVHFLAIFGVDHKVFTCWPKNHECFTCFYLRIYVKIFSDGRRQDFLIDHTVFPNRPKKINDDVFLRKSVNIFSERRR